MKDKNEKRLAPKTKTRQRPLAQRLDTVKDKRGPKHGPPGGSLT